MKKLAHALDAFLAQKGANVHFMLTRLWRDWPEVVGQDIAEMAKPLGHRETTLIVGVEDSMLMQEMHLYAPSFIEQANSYLGMKFFDKVQLDLIGKQVPLDRDPEETPGPRVPGPRRPQKLGGLLDGLDPESPVAKCYRAYVEQFARAGTEEGNPKEE